MSQLIISSGQTSSGIVVDQSGSISQLTVENGGIAIGTIVRPRVTIYTESGGITSNSQIGTWGASLIFSGGIDRNATVSGFAAALGVLEGGAANRTIIDGGARMDVYGYASEASIVSGTVNVSQGGSLDGADLMAGTVNVSSGGVATSTVIHNGALEHVYTGGTAVSAVISRGGSLVIDSGGTIDGATSIVSGQLTLNNQAALASGFYISDFDSSDVIDINNLQFSSGNTSVTYTSGNNPTATITNGTDRFTLALRATLSGTEKLKTIADSDGSTLLVIRGNTVSVGNNTVSSGLLLKNDASADYLNGIVMGGGIASSTQVQSGSLLTVQYGGQAISTILTQGGALDNYGATSGTIISNSSTETIEGPGFRALYSPIAISTMVQSGGSQIVHGTASGTQIQNGGSQSVIGASAIAQNTIISSGGILQAGGVAIWSSGGITSGTQVLNGGIERIYGPYSTSIPASYGAYATTVSSGGIQEVRGGGTAFNTTVLDGGVQHVMYDSSWRVGGIISSTVISGAGTLIVDSGAKIKGAISLSGTGSKIVLNSTDSYSSFLSIYGFSEGDSIDFNNISYSSNAQISYNSGELIVSASGIQYTLLLSQPQTDPGWQFVSYADQTDGSTLIKALNRYYYTSSGEVLSNFTLGADLSTSATQLFAVQYSMVQSSYISSGGIAHISSGASTYSNVILSGGSQIIESGAYSISSLVSAGGIQSVTGIASNTQLYGAETVSGSSVDAAIFNGGVQIVANGGSVENTLVQSGGLQTLSEGGTATSVSIMDGGSQTVLSGGSSFFTTISDGGHLIISSGGLASTTTISGSGTLEVASGGLLSDMVYMAGSGSLLKIDAPSSLAANPLISGFDEGDRLDLGSINATAAGTLVSIDSTSANNDNISYLSVTSGQDTYRLRLSGDYTGWGVSSSSDAQDQSLLLTARRLGIIVTSAADSLSIGGSNPQNYMWVMGQSWSGNTQYTGFATSSTVGANGVQLVLGYAGQTAISSGGTQRVSAGGRATASIIHSGGLQYVYQGGVASNSVIDGAGTLTVQNGGTLSGTLTMSGTGARLEIASPTALASGAQINGFSNGDIIDLNALRYMQGSRTVSYDNTSHLLTISGSGQAYHLKLQGDYSGWAFSQTQDSGDGSTLITGRQESIIVSSGITSSSVLLDTSTVSSMLVMNGGIASGTTVNSGGMQIISSGGTAANTIVSGNGTLIVSSGGHLSGTIDLEGTGGLLQINDPAASQNTIIQGFSNGDYIDLNTLSYTSAVSATIDSATDRLTVTDGTTSYTLQLTGNYAAKRVAVIQDSDGSSKLAIEDSLTPTITGFNSNQSGTDQVPLSILSGVAVSQQSGEGITAAVTITGASGTFTDPSLYGTVSADGKTFTIYGSPAHVTNVLNTLTFTQTAGQAATGQVTTSAINLTVTNNAGTTSRSGIIALRSALLPFADQVFSAVDPNTIITATATLGANAEGTYSHLGNGTLSADGKTYTVTGTVSQVSTALQQLAFSPLHPESVSLSPQVQTSASAPITIQNNSSTPRLLVGGSSRDLIMGGSGADTLVSGPNGGTLNAYGRGSQLVGGGGSTNFVDHVGNTTIYGGQGHDTIEAVGAGSKILTGQAGSQVQLVGDGNLAWSQGADTIYAAGAANTVVGSNAGVYMTTGNSTTFINGTGASTVVGSITESGSPTLFGGAGDLTYYAGNARGLVILDSGNATVATGSANTTVFNGSGHVLYFGNTGYPNTSDTIEGGTGNVTVWSGQNGYFKGGAAGNNLIQAGNNSTVTGGGNGDVLTSRGQNNILIAGSGQETLDGSQGSGTIMYAGTGDNTLIGNASQANSAVDLFVLNAGQAGAHYTIQNFHTWEDRIVLNGYGSADIDAAFTNAINTSAGRVFTLSDQSTITLLDVTTIERSAFG
ncbi:AIDA repeat-containing protein [Granulibacter bethesdensis]|uniref:AIDA repeat-containing protein n=1 Tax=Granulibacter bethesdensis TaxID=364410 RepID=UPI0003F1CDA7|nr:AIDA repeat-containing protein [Granulibacter bethesdensis]AHJ67567.1 Adhesin aidA-I [Granulibacter bethesdensis]